MITLFNVLTRERWELPDSVSANPFFLTTPPYPPGNYDIRNGSGAVLTVVYDSMLTVNIPAGQTWSMSNNENLYSWYPVGVDFAALTGRALARGMWGAAWAPVFPVGNI